MGIKRIKNRSQNFGKFNLAIVIIDYNAVKLLPKILITEWKMEYRKSAEALSPSSALHPNPHLGNWN